MELSETRRPSFRLRGPSRTPKIKRRGVSKGEVRSSPCASPRSSPSSVILDREPKAKCLGLSKGALCASLRSSPSSVILERVILARSPAVRFGDEAAGAEFAQNDFVLETLQWHNFFRVQHRVPPLALSEQLCSLAQFWCNHLAHNNTFYHRNLGDVGENLFCRCSPGDFDVTGQQMAKYWYEEVKSYNFDQEPSTLHIHAGHFSQMIWKSSKEFGIGKAHTRCGKLIVVANYRPSGNIIGEFQCNVFRADTGQEEEALDELEGMVF